MSARELLSTKTQVSETEIVSSDALAALHANGNGGNKSRNHKCLSAEISVVADTDRIRRCLSIANMQMPATAVNRKCSNYCEYMI